MTAAEQDSLLRLVADANNALFKVGARIEELRAEPERHWDGLYEAARAVFRLPAGSSPEKAIERIEALRRAFNAEAERRGE